METGSGGAQDDGTDSRAAEGAVDDAWDDARPLSLEELSQPSPQHPLSASGAVGHRQTRAAAAQAVRNGGSRATGGATDYADADDGTGPSLQQPSAASVRAELARLRSLRQSRASQPHSDRSAIDSGASDTASGTRGAGSTRYTLSSSLPPPTARPRGTSAYAASAVDRLAVSYTSHASHVRLFGVTTASSDTHSGRSGDRVSGRGPDSTTRDRDESVLARGERSSGGGGTTTVIADEESSAVRIKFSDDSSDDGSVRRSTAVRARGASQVRAMAASSSSAGGSSDHGGPATPRTAHRLRTEVELLRSSATVAAEQARQARARFDKELADREASIRRELGAALEVRRVRAACAWLRECVFLCPSCQLVSTCHRMTAGGYGNERRGDQSAGRRVSGCRATSK